ncbi:type VI protein secretion system component VasK [Microbacterium testaceum]|nr:type VI protein secretion system component VasK [Microbacterium testaceum]
MRTNVGLWWLLAVFGFLIAAVYTVWSLLQHGGVEWVGSVALVFLGLMSSMIAFYISRVMKAQRGDLPEDTLTADIDDGDPEMGEFSPLVVVAHRSRCLRGDRGDRSCRRKLARPRRIRDLRHRHRRLGVRVLPRVLRALIPCPFG